MFCFLRIFGHTLDKIHAFFFSVRCILYYFCMEIEAIKIVDKLGSNLPMTNDLNK